MTVPAYRESPAACAPVSGEWHLVATYFGVDGMAAALLCSMSEDLAYFAW